MPEHSGTSMGGSIPTRWPPGRAWKDGWLRVSFWAFEWRLAGDVCAESAAGGVDAGVGVGRTRVLVCTKQRVHADRSHVNPALDAHARRHGGFRGSRCPRGVRRRTENRAFISTIGVRPLSSAPHPAHGAKNQLGRRLPPFEDPRSDCLLHDLFRLPADGGHGCNTTTCTVNGITVHSWHGCSLCPPPGIAPTDRRGQPPVPTAESGRPGAQNFDGVDSG